MDINDHDPFSPIPADRIVETGREAGCRYYGVGRYRGSVRRISGRKWSWRTWDFLSPGFADADADTELIAIGTAKTQDEAIELCTGVLRKAAGIEQVPSGDA